MTTTPLPPLPHKTEDPFRFYTADQMQAYAHQARAYLEAENKRLRELLAEIGRANSAQVAPVYSELARAALESKHGL